MLKRALWICALITGLAGAGISSASAVTVDALENSSSGGVGKITGTLLTAGEAFSVTVASNDLWNAGALPRWSDANGLTGNRFATGSDESGQAAGTQIGQDFGTWSQNSFSAPYGSLVG